MPEDKIVDEEKKLDRGKKSESMNLKRKPSHSINIQEINADA